MGMEPVGKISDERWDKVFAVNTTAVMRAMRIATDIFLEQGYCAIINNIATGAAATNIGNTMINLSEAGMTRQQLGMAINPRVGQPEEFAKLTIFSDRTMSALSTAKSLRQMVAGQ